MFAHNVTCFCERAAANLHGGQQLQRKRQSRVGGHPCFSASVLEAHKACIGTNTQFGVP